MTLPPMPYFGYYYVRCSPENGGKCIDEILTADMPASQLESNPGSLVMSHGKVKNSDIRLEQEEL